MNQKRNISESIDNKLTWLNIGVFGNILNNSIIGSTISDDINKITASNNQLIEIQSRIQEAENLQNRKLNRIAQTTQHSTNIQQIHIDQQLRTKTKNGDELDTVPVAVP